MAPIERKTQFHMMLSADEERMLRQIAEADGLSASDYLRTTLRREHAKREFPPASKRPRAKKGPKP